MSQNRPKFKTEENNPPVFVYRGNMLPVVIETFVLVVLYVVWIVYPAQQTESGNSLPYTYAFGYICTIYYANELI